MYTSTIYKPKFNGYKCRPSLVTMPFNFVSFAVRPHNFSAIETVTAQVKISKFDLPSS